MGYMDGNLVGTVYYNHGEVADWLNEPAGAVYGQRDQSHLY